MNNMDCKTACRILRERWDRDCLPLASSPAAGQADLTHHLRQCRACSRLASEQLDLRNSLHALPRPLPPPDLTLRLRSLAGRERSRIASLRSRQPFSAWTRRRLHLRDVMGPLAVPFAGGLCSAVMLFSMLVPSFTPSVGSLPDVPIALSTQATVKNIAPLGFGASEAVVDLTVDGRGRIVDYSIVSGAGSGALRRGIENSLLFTVFTPATEFGQPMAGKIRLTFRNSHIDVRG